MLKFKLLSIFYYFLLALPYLYLIIQWKDLIPPVAAEGRQLGNKIFFRSYRFYINYDRFLFTTTIMV